MPAKAEANAAEINKHSAPILKRPTLKPTVTANPAKTKGVVF